MKRVMDKPKRDKMTVGAITEDLNDDLGELLLSGFGIDVPLAFTYEELQVVEKRFMEMWSPAKPMKTETSIMFGWYLGETIIRNIPGSKWNNPESEDVLNMSVSVYSKMRAEEISREILGKEDEEKKEGASPASFICYPSVRVRKFAKNHEDRMTNLFRMLLLQCKYSTKEILEMGRPMDDGWYLLPDGDMIRITTLDKEATKAADINEKSGAPFDADIPLESRKPLRLNDDGELETSDSGIETLDSPQEAARKIREAKKNAAEEADRVERVKHKVRGKDNYKF